MLKCDSSHHTDRKLGNYLGHGGGPELIIYRQVFEKEDIECRKILSPGYENAENSSCQQGPSKWRFYNDETNKPKHKYENPGNPL